MASLHDIKRRRASVRKIQKITRAMKMVAAAKLRRAQETLQQARPYAFRLRELVGDLALRAEPSAHPLLRRDNVANGRVTAIVVTADRGYCGGFNSNIINEVLRNFDTRFEGRPVELVAIGRRGADSLSRKLSTVTATYTGVQDSDVVKAARDIVAPVAQRFANGETDEVVVLFNEFRSAIAQRVTLERLLPFEASDTHAAEAFDYVYEPSAAGVFGALFARHMETQMHRVLLESAAGEYGARMTAMESATNNAADVIERLTLQYNRARQDAITKELIEVISGSEAL